MSDSPREAIAGWPASAGQRLTAFRAFLAARGGPVLAAQDAEALDAFSLAEPDAFWRALWAFTELPGDPGARDRSSDGTMAGTRFFPDGRVNFTEALLRGPADALAILARDETGAETRLTRGALRDAVACLATQLAEGGFGPGDRLCALTPNRPEAVVAALATAALGGTFASCSPDFAPRAVLDRFAPLKPKALLVSDGSRYKGRAMPLGETAAQLKAALNPALALSYAVLGTGLDGFTPLRKPTPGAGDSWRADDRGALDPLYVLFSSGTTGAPKGIIHGTAGPLLQHLKEHQLHCDMGPGDRLLYYTTCGWMMWNWLVSALASGTAIGLYDGAPDAPGTGGEDAFLSFARAGGFTHLGTSPAYLTRLAQLGDGEPLPALRVLLSTGAPLPSWAWGFAKQRFGDVPLCSISGGTDLLGCFALGHPERPMEAGALQGRGLAMAMDFDHRDDEGTAGELVCRAPFPSQPLGLIDDPTGERLRATYFPDDPNTWRHGDYGYWTEKGGVVLLGRADAVLNRGGVRMGTAEFYGPLEALSSLTDCLIVDRPAGDDLELILFVVPAPGVTFDAALEQEIRHTLRTQASPRHSPDRILPVTAIPRTRSGKRVELAVRDRLRGRAPKNLGALESPEAIEALATHPGLG
jgi:acetoacetyl-CoA synthetase